jgi:hypothetical protein
LSISSARTTDSSIPRGLKSECRTQKLCRYVPGFLPHRDCRRFRAAAQLARAVLPPHQCCRGFSGISNPVYRVPAGYSSASAFRPRRTGENPGNVLQDSLHPQNFADRQCDSYRQNCPERRQPQIRMKYRCRYSQYRISQNTSNAIVGSISRPYIPSARFSWPKMVVRTPPR